MTTSTITKKELEAQRAAHFHTYRSHSQSRNQQRKSPIAQPYSLRILPASTSPPNPTHVYRPSPCTQNAQHRYICTCTYKDIHTYVTASPISSTQASHTIGPRRESAILHSSLEALVRNRYAAWVRRATPKDSTRCDSMGWDV